MITMEKEPLLMEAVSREPEVRVQRVTPEMAAAWLSTDMYVHQRNLRHWHVKRLALAIARGEFKPGTLEFCRAGESRFLVDGQHRLMALVTSETTQTFVIVEYVYPTMEEVRDHYARTDIGMRRATADAPNFQLLREELSLSGPELRAFVASVPLLAGGFDPGAISEAYATHSPDARFEIASQFKEAASPYFRIVEAGKRQTRKHLLIAGCTAVALITFRDQKEKATAFWERIAQLAGYEPDTGEQHLVAYFLEPKQQHIRAWEHARVVARCWSLYFDEQRVSYLRRSDTSMPIRIAGTIYDGRSVRLL